jgi:hypothetical protein
MNINANINEQMNIKWTNEQGNERKWTDRKWTEMNKNEQK